MAHRGRCSHHSFCPRAVCCKPCTGAAALTPEAPFISPQPQGKPLKTVWLQDLKQTVQTTNNTDKSLSAAAARRGAAAAVALCSHSKQSPPALRAAPSHSRTAKRQASLSTATHPPVPHTLWGLLRQCSLRQSGTCWAHTAWPCKPEKICYLDFKVITLIRSDCSNVEPPSTGHPKELLEDARAVTEPSMLVADGQRLPQELHWLAASLGWHRSVQDLMPPDFFTFPQRRLGAAERAKLSSLSVDLPFHISARPGTLT